VDGDANLHKEENSITIIRILGIVKEKYPHHFCILRKKHEYSPSVNIYTEYEYNNFVADNKKALYEKITKDNLRGKET